MVRVVLSTHRLRQEEALFTGVFDDTVQYFDLNGWPNSQENCYLSKATDGGLQQISVTYKQHGFTQ